MTLKELPVDTEALINELAIRGREARARGDYASAEQYFLKAWTAIPDPKFDYHLGQIMAVGLVRVLADMGNVHRAEEFLDLVEPTYGAHDASMVWLRATVDFHAGRLDQAYAGFDELHKNFGRRPFQEQEPRYWQFYSNKQTRA